MRQNRKEKMWLVLKNRIEAMQAKWFKWDRSKTNRFVLGPSYDFYKHSHSLYVMCTSILMASTALAFMESKSTLTAFTNILLDSTSTSTAYTCPLMGSRSTLTDFTSTLMGVTTALSRVLQSHSLNEHSQGHCTTSTTLLIKTHREMYEYIWNIR